MAFLRPGEIVRYRHPERGEEQLTFDVVELRGDLVVLRSRNFPGATIVPQESCRSTMSCRCRR